MTEIKRIPKASREPETFIQTRTIDPEKLFQRLMVWQPDAMRKVKLCFEFVQEHSDVYLVSEWTPYKAIVYEPYSENDVEAFPAALIICKPQGDGEHYDHISGEFFVHLSYSWANLFDALIMRRKEIG